MNTFSNIVKTIIHRFRLQLMCMDISCILVRVGWILFFLVGCYHIASSQNSKTVYHHSVDYINCKFAAKSLEDYDIKMYEDYLEIFPVCYQTDDDFFGLLSQFLIEKDMTSTLKLCTEINNLKQGYNQEFRPGDEVDGEDMYNTIRDKLFDLQAVKAFQSRRRTSFPKLKSDILQQLQTTLEPEITTSTEPAVISADNEYLQSTEVENEEEFNNIETLEEERNPNLYSQTSYGENSFISRRDILWIFVLMMFGLLAFYFIRSVMPRYTVNENYESLQIDDSATKKLLEKLTTQVKELRTENNSLKEELEVLTFRVSNLDEPVQINKTAIETIHEKIENTIEEINEAPENIPAELIDVVVLREFFMPIPYPEGDFNGNDALENFKRAESVYKFHLLGDSTTEAEYKICDDVATMIRALDNPDVYLKPACRSNAIIPISATKILTDESGLAIYKNGEWKIVRKALIRYT